MSSILVIDDDFQIRHMIRLLLRKMGHDVALADDGKPALELLRRKPFDIVITDLIMSEKEGIETIIEIRRDYPRTRIIAISGGGRCEGKDYLRLAKALGAKYTFHKPFDPKQLGRAVEALLASEDDVGVFSPAVPC